MVGGGTLTMLNKYIQLGEKLIRLLLSEKDGLIFLNGKWGSGKTYFIKNIFTSLYNKKASFYISLMGGKDLSDFKNKLITECYLNNFKKLKDDASNLGEFASIPLGKPQYGPVIRNIVDKVSDSIYENVISSSDYLFIIDDIERIDAKLRNDIIFYCHNKSMQSKSIEFLLIGNFSDENDFELEHKEKLIAHEIIFKPSNEDLIEFISSIANGLSQEDNELILKCMKYYSLSNLRTCKKIISTIKELSIVPQPFSDENHTLKVSKADVIYQIFATQILIDNFHITIDDINLFNPYIEESQNANGKDKLLKTLYTGIGKQVSEFILSEITKNELFSHMYIKKLTNPKDIALSMCPYDYDINSNELIKQYEYILISNPIKELSEWLTAFDNYNWLVNDKYICESRKINDTSLNAEFNKFTFEEKLDYYYKLIENSRYYSSRRLSRQSHWALEINALCRNHIQKIKKLKAIDSAMNDGWSSISTEIEKSENTHKPLEYIGISPIINGIYRGKWTVSDILYFSEYIKDLYSFSNIKDFLLGELSHLESLQQKLNLFLNLKKPSLRYGAVYELNKTINNCIDRLKAK